MSGGVRGARERGLRASLGAGVLLLALGACRGIVGYHDVEYLAVDGACAPPSLPTQGAGRVRLVNAGTRGGNIDACVRASGTADWGDPVLAGGALCDTGLAYAQATLPFAVPAGTLDVEIIPAGATCAATPLSQALGVDVGDWTQGASVVTLLRFGADAEGVVPLPEEPATGAAAPGPNSYELRLVNAIASGEAINAGFTSSPSLPATVAEPLLPVPIEPGHVEPAIKVVSGFRSFDDQGYANVLLSTVTLGFVRQGEHDAIFTVQTPGTADVQSLFAVGDSRDPAHPIRGLLCEDAASAPDAGAPDAATADTGLVLAPCVLSSLPSIAVDTFNTALYGAQAAFNDQRRPFVIDAIAARSSDLMCLLETALDYEAIVKSAQGRFPYAYYVVTDLDTPPTDPTDQNGETPPPPSGPPCAGVDPGVIQSIYDCVAQNCTTTGDMNGTISTTNCLSGACAWPFVQIYYQGQQQDACFDCIIGSANSEYPLAKGRDECTNDAREPFAYGGMNGTLMLSRYPLANQQAFVLPGDGIPARDPLRAGAAR